MFTGAAQRAGLTRLKPGAVIFQIFNRFFPLAERFQVEIVLVFVFVLRPALRQGSVEFCLLRLRLLYSGAGIVNGCLLRPQRGLLGRQIGFQLVQPCAVAGIVDAKQQFALLH
ncbi:hypothetical protein SB00610_02804 [Klebsiella quasipneumoniae subsp. similipneumoniae]|nr:hypothetical protein SB00610_02804 [Klebsiella quasipneumoniae subsp. similipneumoniae]